MAPGETVELEYRAPMWAFIGGSLGPPPQRYRGMAATIAMFAAVIVLLCLCCGLGVLGSM